MLDGRRRSSETGMTGSSLQFSGMHIAEGVRPMPAEQSGQRSRSQSDLDSQDPDVRTALLQLELENARRELSGVAEEVNASFKDWKSRQQPGHQPFGFATPPPPRSKIKRSPQSFDPAHRLPPAHHSFKKGRSYDNISEYTSEMAGVGTESEKRQRAILRRSGSSTNISVKPLSFEIEAGSRRTSGGGSGGRLSGGGSGGKSPSAASWKGSPDWKGDSSGSFKSRNNTKGKDTAKWNRKQAIKENQEWKAMERTEGIDNAVEGVGGAGADEMLAGSLQGSHSPQSEIIVSQLQVRQRLEDLKRLEDKTVEMRRELGGFRRGVPSLSRGCSLLSVSGSVEGAATRVQAKSEWKIKFSTDEFWIQLRARVKGVEEAEERRRVAAAREAVNSNEFIDKIKKYAFGGARSGCELDAAVKEVGALLAELDAVVETAYPCAHASGVGKHRLPNHNIRLERPNSVAFHNPEFSCGSLEDNSTFVSNLQALRAWHAAAQVGMAAKAELEKTASEVRWESPDLDGLLHRVPMRDVTSLILARAKPALEKLHGLYRDTVREVAVTDVGKVNADGTFDKTSKKLLKIVQPSFEKQLGDKGMRLPNLASAGGLAGSLAMLPLQVLLKIVSSRVAHQPKAAPLQRWWAGRVFQQRFEECIQLLQAGRDYQEELREYLPGVLDDPADGGQAQRAAVPAAWKALAEDLELQMRQVLYMGFSFCSARNLEIAGPGGGGRSADASAASGAGSCGAKDLREACIDLRREEVPQLIDCLSMFKEALVAEETAGHHCGVLELLVRKGRQLLEEAAEWGGARAESDWASEVEQATGACWAAVRVARAGIGVLGLCGEVEFEGAVQLLEGLYDKDYVWLRGDRQSEASAMEQRQRRSKAREESKERGADAEDAEEEEEGQTLVFASPLLFVEEEEELGRERCTALLKASYGVDGKLYDDFGGHLVRIWVPNSCWEDVRRIWEQNCAGNRADNGDANAMSVVRLPGLEEALEQVVCGKGRAILTGPNSYTLEQEMANFRAKLPEGVLSEGCVTRPNRQAVVEAVARVTAELQAVEKSSSALVESWARKWGLVNEAQPNAAWTTFPSMALPTLPAIGVSEFATLQKMFDLAGYTSSALSSGEPSAAATQAGRCKWSVARSWALARMAVPRDESRGGAMLRSSRSRESEDGEHVEVAPQVRQADMTVTAERIRYFEEALRGAVALLTDEEWAWWLGYFEAVWIERRDWERTEDWVQTMLAGVVRSSGGEMKARMKAVEELEEREKRKMQEKQHAGRVQEEQKHMERMVLRDEHGQKLHWIKLGKLGEGAFGEVFRAQFWQSMDFVAVKQITRSKNWPETVAKVENEMRVMAMLRHTNVVRCYGLETSEGSARRMYVFIEYCAEGHLRGLVKSWMANGSRQANAGSVVPLKIVRNYTMQLAWALQHIHARGIIHRDIKTMNILVANGGNAVKVCDFGEAIELPPGASWPSLAPKEPCGTIGHWAPELVQCFKTGGRDSAAFGPKIDVWALGCVVTEMLTGQDPTVMIWKGPAGKGVNVEELNRIISVFLLCNLVGNNPEALALPYRQSLQTLPADSDVPAFLDRCFAVRPHLRPSASELLEEPFLLRR